MLRSLLVIALGAAITWLVLRLSRSFRRIMPGKHQDLPPPYRDDQIIDAEFEDLDEDQ
ncbi:MAG: hypothetical protein IIA60_02995 [Candidatus Marinimicrobia bacterium]|nr:hypothetical protein [Candidatus Neomarinimicrobiota bacterium]